MASAGPSTEPGLLVHFAGAVGDLILALPALNALADRHRHVIQVALPGDRHFILHDFPGLSPCHPDGLGLHELYAGRVPDRLAQYQEIWLPSREPRAAEGPVRWYTPPPAGCRGTPHATRRYLNALAPGAAVGPIQLGHPTPDGPIALHPGSGSKEKNWPGWSELAHRLGADRLLVISGPAERERGTPLPAAQRTLRDRPLAEVAAALRGCCVMAGNDSGIAHLAAALGLPTVVAFTTSDPVTWAPSGAMALTNPTVEAVHSAILGALPHPP